ncbi:unnamed protein product, partial [Ectocarpus fasciculatus]
AVAEFVVLDQQPFNVVEAPSLQNLVQVAANDTNLKLPSRPTVAKKVWTMAICAEATLRDKMQGTHPALTTDCWTSNSGVSYECCLFFDRFQQRLFFCVVPILDV